MHDVDFSTTGYEAEWSASHGMKSTGVLINLMLADFYKSYGFMYTPAHWARME